MKKDFRKEYNPTEIESKWQKIWEKQGIYQPDLKRAKRPFYNLMMFPYPSAEGLHVGNVYAFVGADIYGRFARMKGNDVFEPIGLDGFGIHSENYAIKMGRHPKVQAKKSEKSFYHQLHLIGNGFSWKQHLETYDPSYYKWTQWIFVKMFKHGLAYRSKAEVNWCLSCKTVLSDEQVERKLKTPAVAKALAGKQKSKIKSVQDTAVRQLADHGVEEKESVSVCERCKNEVEKREMEQWFFKITKYAQKLLDNLMILDWPEKIKRAQTNWIGRSEGSLIRFKVQSFGFAQDKSFGFAQDKRSEFKINREEIEVFTTRPDTVFGATFIVLAPEHKLVATLLGSRFNPSANRQSLRLKKIRKYVERASVKTEAERIAQGRKKTGVFTGLYCINPVNSQRIPIYIADYVVKSYGTGAIMGVPGQDRRDFEFAAEVNLPIIPVVKPKNTAKSLILKGSFESRLLRELKNNNIDYITNSKGNLEITLNAKQVNKYIKLVRKYLKKNWWVEIVGCRTTFVFSDEILDIVKKEDEDKILVKCKKIEPTIKNINNLWHMLWQVEHYKDLVCWEKKEGIMINSGILNNLEVAEAIKKIIKVLETKRIGEAKTAYKLRDWCISRQRYWGPPIPMIYCQKCARQGKSWFDTKEAKRILNTKYNSSTDGLNTKNKNMKGWFPVAEQNLPILLPDVEDWRPKGTGKGPLANIASFVKTTCPLCGAEAVRETDVSDTFLDSSWYFLRYPSIKVQSSKFKVQSSKKKQNNIRYNNVAIEQSGKDTPGVALDSPGVEGKESLPWSPQLTNKWLPVDAYIGGAEHAVLHLMYSRFISMAFHDMGYLHFAPANGEPFPFLFSHGLIIAQGTKMSKSKGNVVVPDAYIKKYGTDTLRCYLMFLGPYEQGGAFRDAGIAGMHRFLQRVWRVGNKMIKSRQYRSINDAYDILFNRLIHRTIRDVSKDIATFNYNTALAFLMIFINNFTKMQDKLSTETQRRAFSKFLLLFAPFAPYLTEELWNKIRLDFSIHQNQWPSFDPELIKEEKVKIIIQVNGKFRDLLQLKTNQAKTRITVENLAKKSPKLKRHLKDKKIENVIFVPKKLINFVVK